jgi:hypothetical protein
MTKGRRISGASRNPGVAAVGRWPEARGGGRQWFRHCEGDCFRSSTGRDLATYCNVPALVQSLGGTYSEDLVAGYAGSIHIEI